MYMMYNGCYYRISIRSQTCGVKQGMKHDTNHRNQPSDPVDSNLLPNAWFPYNRPDRPNRPDRSK